MMNKKVKISIVVPVYNQEKYLDISIPSLLSQTYTNIEIIIVNDGSIDSSEEIIKKYSSNDNRIKVIEKNNGGLVDATIYGIKNATGDYVAFLDPDDRVDSDFIENFINELTEGVDIISMGYYLDNLGTLTPCYLYKTGIYTGEKLKELTRNFIYESGNISVSNKIFISRWNKLYRAELLKEVIKDFEACKDISLGEDTIFTSLVLNKSKKVKVIEYPNSYFYNIGNQNSMMNSSDIRAGIQKSRIAYNKIKQLSNISEDQALALYFFLIENLFQKKKKVMDKSFDELFKYLKKDTLYQKALSHMVIGCSNKIKKIELNSRKLLTGNQYMFCFSTLSNIKSLAKFFLREIPSRIQDIRKSGFYKAYRFAEYRKDRRKAREDLINKLPIVEQEVLPFLKKYVGKSTPVEETALSKNIFVFWWDGFESAPNIVRKCLESVKKYNPDSNIIEVSKNNFEDYTDIHPEILKGFYKGDISIQTFSDILRFNLLKNNGGAWIDATILFLEKFDIFEELKDKSFATISFTSSMNFLKYKNEVCSWSGYFIASRKGGYFVTVMNDLFEEYYLLYGKFPFYFFIDALFVICKINKIDNDVLSKTKFVCADMFLLPKLYDKDFNIYSLKQLTKIPQKLSWSHKGNSKLTNSFFNRLEL